MISIVLPSFNRARILPKAVESILRQTYKDFELIIVDDGSSDNTREVVKSFNDDRIVYVHQENAGACVARNNGIDHARGEYIAFQDSDDIWHEDKLEKQLKALQEKNADIVFCRMNRMSDGKKIGLVSDYFKEGFLSKDVMPMSIGTQTLIGKSIVFKQEKFDSEMPRFQEFELLVRAQKNYSIYCMEEPLVDYIIQTDSLSVNPLKYTQAWELMLMKHPDFLERYNSSRDRMACDVVRNAFLTVDKKLRWQMIVMALKFKTSPRMIYRLLKFSLFN
ncbi:glycosyltransferase family A protein [Fibrobacter succinogenes]|uniref:glycosyltransferase family 2 protein n=1 Tax=Fibrobacter succinogenes TaxID=833 RepID=UPI0013D378C3|nr:glycosyltransferase family A protein [Fibrobacter succinogenes]